jgi:1-acyl-sn-glycerol-3-phosphate acyltransferase
MSAQTSTAIAADPLECGRDPDFIRRSMPVLDFLLAYFDPEIQGFAHVPPAGPMLIVSNHSGGIYMPDYWAFLRHWVRERGPDEPLYSLSYDLLFAVPAVGALARRFGAVPANHDNAGHLLAQGHPVLVYPGGDQDDYRPWTERHLVELRGRTGFLRLALRNRVPVVPLVAHGSHDAIFVIARGEGLAHRIGIDKWLRVKVLPFVAGLPWGVAIAPIPTVPVPAKVTVRVCEPMDWQQYGPEAADDPMVVRRCYEELLGRMQSNLDELVAAEPHPVLARLRDPARRGSLVRQDRA